MFVLSELAELHTFRGEYESAESVCREGLALLEGASGASPEFRGPMEVTLRASLGHLELRRMSLEAARREFEAALRLARRWGKRSMRALISNNLGVVLNQLNRFADAERHFREAESLLTVAGERRALVQTACNLAVIAAKRADAALARDELERATRLLREHSGARLEFFVEISHALTYHLLGHLEDAIEHFERALPQGRRLGDEYLVGFGELYLVEAHLVCGNIGEAARVLRSNLSRVREHGPAVLRRLSATRALLLESWLGRSRAAASARRLLDTAPRTDIALPELWNDLWLDLVPTSDKAGRADGRGEESDASPDVVAACRQFAHLGVPAGRRFAAVALLGRALTERDTTRVRKLALDVERGRDDSHRVLSVVEPLACAEAALACGQLERAEQLAQEAASAIVGRPFLELDWQVELHPTALVWRSGAAIERQRDTTCTGRFRRAT